MVTFLSTRAAKLARKHAVNISHSLIPDHCLHCLFKQGWDPILVDITMLIVGNIIFDLLPILRPVALLWYPPSIHRHGLETMHCEGDIPLLCQLHLAPLNGLVVPCFHPHKSRMRGKVALIRGGTKVQPLDLVVPNQNRLFMLLRQCVGPCQATADVPKIVSGQDAQFPYE